MIKCPECKKNLVKDILEAVPDKGTKDLGVTCSGCNKFHRIRLSWKTSLFCVEILNAKD